jgi:serine protease Do
MVGNTKPGTRASLIVLRRGSQKELSVTVAEIEPERSARRTSAAPDPRPPAASPAAQSLGLAVAELSEAQKNELKIKGGVRVESAAEAAARAGLREGDVIVAIGNTEVANVREFEAALERADRSKPLPVLVRRGESAAYALIRPAAR